MGPLQARYDGIHRSHTTILGPNVRLGPKVQSSTDRYSLDKAVAAGTSQDKSAAICRQNLYSEFSFHTSSLSLQPPSRLCATICICNLGSADWPCPSAAPLSVACCNLYLQSGICRPCPQPCSSPLPRMLQSAFAIWDLQTPPLSPSLR